MQYLITFFGSFLYNLGLFVAAKNLADKNNVEFDYKKYSKNNWDNWVLTLAIAPVLVWYAPDIVGLLNDRLQTQMKFYNVYYMGAGPLTEVVLFGLYKLAGWKETFLAPGHK
jgi:hypothetical protein